MSRGIRTIEDIRQRCYVEEATGCWHWRGATHCGRPSIWSIAKQSAVTAGVLIAELTIPDRLPRNTRWRQTCGNLMCCRPEHQFRTTHSAVIRNARPHLDPLHKERIRRGRSVYPDAVVEACRLESGTLAEIGARHGVHPSSVSKYRRGETRPSSLTRLLGAT